MIGEGELSGGLPALSLICMKPPADSTVGRRAAAQAIGRKHPQNLAVRHQEI